MVKATVWVAVLVALTAGGVTLLGDPAGEPPARSGGGDGPSTAVAALRDIETTVLSTGVLRPEVGAEVRVGSRISGVLTELHVTIGDTVRRGELLALLDPTELETRRREVAAELESARVELEFARRDLGRARELATGGVIPEAELDRMERTEQLAGARVGRLEAALASAEIQLGYTRIVAPISGVVADVATQVGETVAASFAAPTFVTILDLDRLEVWAYVDETDIGRIRPAQRATFTVDTYPGHEFGGTVTAIQPAAEIVDDVVNYVTRIAIDPAHGRTLRPEMTARVDIVTDGRRGVLAIPTSAVRRDREGAFVLVPGAEGPVRRPVRTGFRGGDLIEIEAGLAAGDTVLVGPVDGAGRSGAEGTGGRP